MAATAWSTQHLCEFLDVFGALEREPMLEVALERIVTSFDAEFVSVVHNGREERRHGQQRDAACHLMTAPDGACTTSNTRLIVGRSATPFGSAEQDLLCCMARALEIALATVDLVADSRQLAMRLFEIQRAISHRAPLQEILDAITQTASELLAAEVVGLRVRSLETGGSAYSSLQGYSPAIAEDFNRVPLEAGFSGRAFVENRLVVSENYAEEPGRISRNHRYALQSAMAAPVHVHGEPVGVLNVATSTPDRVFSEAERATFSTLAEHASLAVNDASVVQQLRRSLKGATFQARHDPLTGLLNRTSVVELLDKALAVASSVNPVCVLFIDLDRFKNVNDLFGHAVGDGVLSEVARRLADSTRRSDHVARLSGDEFVIIMTAANGIEGSQTAARVSRELSETMLIGGRRICLTASVGVAEAVAPITGQSLLADADLAMYRAKQHGRARVVHFDQAMRFEMLQRSNLERELLVALEESQLVAFFQPIVRLDSGEISSVETLIRWRHPTLGLISPEDFISLAEDTGLIARIDRFVLETACEQVAEWTRSTGTQISVSVNISAGQCTDASLVTVVRETLERTGLAPERLWLEITESVVLDDTDVTLSVLREIWALGVRFMIDDFGTGYSSLVYLKRFPVGALKIDRSFVDGLGTDPDDEAIVTAIVRLGEALGHDVVAEGVETPDHVEWLRRLGCRRAQGFLFCPPVDGATLGEMLAQGRRFDHTITALAQRGSRPVV